MPIWKGTRTQVCSPFTASAISAAVPVALLAALASSPARAADCAVSGYYPTARTPASALSEAGALAANGRYADARAVYLWILARDPQHAEAQFGLARVDSWGGCFTLARKEYREVLDAHPGDADVRAGYIDLLSWSGRPSDAQLALEQGLALDPASISLAVRASRFAWWRGDAADAVTLADRAESAAPQDPETRAARDAVFLGEARLTGHVDAYPPGYPTLSSLGAQWLQHVGRFELYAGGQIVARTATDNATRAVVDGRYPVGVVYHAGVGKIFGAEVAPGAPSNAIPGMALKAWVGWPIIQPVDASFAYSFWYYSPGGQTVHIFNPGVGADLPLDLRVDLRAWVTTATLPAIPGNPGSTRVEGAVGAQVEWLPSPRYDVGVTYTYGTETDPALALYQLLELRSHIASVFGDWLPWRRLGVRPMFGVEYRMPMNIFIESFEVGVYSRY